MQEIKILPIDGSGELRIGIEPGLPESPVVALLPIFDQALERSQGDAIAGTYSGELIAPANTSEPDHRPGETRCCSFYCSFWFFLSCGLSK